MAKKVTPKPAVPDVATPSTDAPKTAKSHATTAPVTPAVSVDPSDITEQMIAERAYHKWANGEPGDHHHHWITSERELRGGG